MLKPRRSGYTMFEVVLVVAVLVVAGAISIPSIMPMLTSNHLQAASDMVRSRWAEMRTRAVADGRSYRFSIIENTGKFRIAPDEDETSSSEAPPFIVEGTLPGKVLFATAQAGSGGSHTSSGSWTRVLTFTANGTSHEDVQVAFGQAGSRPLVLRLRGTTGAVTAEEGRKS